jgi:hypothetical protein
VFAVKFHPDDENLILSAGWDNTVQIYDLRAGLAVRTIFGPHVCGDALDIATAAGGGYLLTGSWRPEEQLQVRKPACIIITHILAISSPRRCGTFHQAAWSLPSLGRAPLPLPLACCRLQLLRVEPMLLATQAAVPQSWDRQFPQPGWALASVPKARAGLEQAPRSSMQLLFQEIPPALTSLRVAPATTN